MLYSILNIKKETDDNTKIEVELNPQHELFEGHFPGNPVLPGASMVQMMKELVEKTRECKLELKKASNIKFIALVQPQVNKVLTFDIQSKLTPDGLLSVSNTIYAGGEPSMKFSGTYKVK